MSHLRSGVLPGLMVSPLAMGVLGVCPGGWGSLPVLEKWGWSVPSALPRSVS